MSTLAAAAKGDAAPLSTTPALKSGSGGANAAAGAATTTTTTGTGTATGTAATTKDSEEQLAGSAAPAAPALAAGSVTDMGAFGQISSPHELTDWVDGVLDQLEARFASMSSQVDLRSAWSVLAFMALYTD